MERLRLNPEAPLYAWAGTIHLTSAGIAYHGRFPGEVCVAMFEQAADAIAPVRRNHLPLSRIGLARRIDSAAVALSITPSDSAGG